MARMNGSDPFFAEAAALIGEPARANILAALMDGRAWTAKELAFAAGVSPQTTSGHLARLTEGRLLTVVAQGRHRYYRLAGPAVARAVEALMAVAVEGAPRHRPPSRAGAELSAARTCYDHLAGRLGVAIHDVLVARGAFSVSEGGYAVSEAGLALFAELGIDAKGLCRGSRPGSRPLARPCLDWSERRPHLAGSVAAALACRCLDQGWIERRPGSRAVRLTPAGARSLHGLIGLTVCEEVGVQAA
jgi:DNA-binding transcriptional ArsR family regulator